MALPPNFLDELRARTPLPAVIGGAAALAAGAPQIWDEVPGNLAFHHQRGDHAAVAEAMKQAGTVEDTAKIAAALGNMTYDGVAGRVCFGKDMRTAMYDSGLVIVKDGKASSSSIPSSCP